jgi:hypothetical protein
VNIAHPSFRSCGHTKPRIVFSASVQRTHLARVDVLDNLLDPFRRLFQVADMTLNYEDVALHHLMSLQDKNVDLFVSEFLR